MDTITIISISNSFNTTAITTNNKSTTVNNNNYYYYYYHHYHYHIQTTVVHTATLLIDERSETKIKNFNSPLPHTHTTCIILKHIISAFRKMLMWS